MKTITINQIELIQEDVAEECADDFDKGWQSDPIPDQHLSDVGKRWRLQSRQVKGH